jgi:hypothetical protein
MASRGGPGVGVYVTITILAVLSLTLFILTFVFLSKYQAAEQTVAQRNADLRDFVTQDERLSEAAQTVVQSAKRASPPRSAFAYMVQNQRDIMSRVTGAPGDTVEQFDTKLKAIDGASTTNLLAALQERQSRVGQLQAQLKQAEDSRQRALADQENEVKKRVAYEQTHASTITALNAEVGQYKAEVDALRDETNEFRKAMDIRVQRIVDDTEAEKAAMRRENTRLSTEVSSLNEQLKIARGLNQDSLFSGSPEEALVDGTVVALNPTAGTVSINRGRKDHVRLGMTFAVYTNASVIKPDADGNYPRGKASIEIVSVGENDSTARIKPESEIRGNPVIRGDVIANAVYDPNKVYKFVVFGSFDANGDRLSTPEEIDDVRSMIEDWGGRVIENLAGDVDFLVLGERPVVPPQPGAGATIDTVRQWQQFNAAAQQYDQLLNQAQTTSIPILNQNRLNTLIGRTPGAPLR